MRLDRLWIDGWNNLQDVTIDFDKSRLTSVVIGQNGTGKSNLLEAIAHIFRNVDLNELGTTLLIRTPLSHRQTCHPHCCKKQRVDLFHKR